MRVRDKHGIEVYLLDLIIFGDIDECRRKSTLTDKGRGNEISVLSDTIESVFQQACKIFCFSAKISANAAPGLSRSTFFLEKYINESWSLLLFEKANF